MDLSDILHLGSRTYAIPGNPATDVYLLPVSGGADSTALAMLLHEIAPHIPFRMVFTDTGAEEKDTLDMLDRLEKWLGKPIERLQSKGLFELIEEFNGFLPSPTDRYCTRELKLVPFRKWIAQFAGKQKWMCVGIRSDEQFRLAFTLPEVETLMPFVDMGINREWVYQKLSATVGISKSYQTGSRSGCTVCPYQRKSELVGMLQRNPLAFDQGAKCEKLSMIDSSRHSPGVPLWKDTSIAQNWHSLPVPLSDEDIQNEVINFVEARKKVFPERLHYVFFIRDYQDKVIGHEVLPSSVGWRYKTVEPFPRADNEVVYPVKEKTEVRLLGVQHVGVFDIDGRKRIELRSSEGDEAFESACRFADRLGKPWKVSGSSELFDPETQRCWSLKTSWTATVHSTAINPNKLQTAEAPSQGKTEEGNAFPVLFQIDPQSKEATGTVMPFCSPACREAAGTNHGLGETRQGESTSSDFGYTVHCEQCGKEVGSQAGDGQNPGIAKAQREALAKLKLALQECTETGLFDVMTVDVHPDLINAFCDEAGRFELNGKAT